MGLRIQNNIAAMNAHRQLSIADAGLSKSLERLSSGYRINKAADDAAGLAISQQFRADIASFKVASRNTAEASSLLQVAEGSLDQMGNILTRLKELATQAASGNAGTNIQKISDEANQLILEFDRIATSTEYAGTALLTGNLAAGTKSGAITAHAGSASTKSLKGEGGTWYDTTVTGQLATGTMTAITGTLDSAIANLEDANNTWTITKAGTASGFTVSNGKMTYAATLNTATTLTITGMGENQGNLVITSSGMTTANVTADTIAFNNIGLSSVSVDAGTTDQAWTLSTVGSNLVLTGANGSNQSVAEPAAGGTVDFDELGISFTVGAEWDTTDLNSMVITTSGTAGSSMTFQIGSQDQADNQLAVSLSDAQAAAMSLVSNMMDSASDAQDALTTIDTAIASMNTQRGNVGAYMNRLSYAASNLSTTIENIQAAESVIRDVDMAAEMTAFTKNQILMQASTSMLAQANMAPQNILSLFGG
jgi:flagellin